MTEKSTFFKELTPRSRTYELRGQRGGSIYKIKDTQTPHTVLQKLPPKAYNTPLSCLGDSNANWPAVVKQARSFMLACYGVPKLDSMTQARANLWKTRVGRGSSIMPKLCSLPPTDPAFIKNLKRAHFQICIWKHALDLNVPDLDLVQHG